ncbi:MAG: beta-ketoacyl-[acyl-carrier-protein] synthase family protein [Planctomycetaceae bacterium]|jgi:3-oxoacyl-[acyl-carrier-protein] synthase II|nr:beta-ketoacyl-[acyl-carrier-protein] synthase family protein [Planctomycetaceae bacterium]
MNQRRVVITGMGQVSPLPADLGEFWNSLITGQGAVRPQAQDSGVPCPIAVAAPARFLGTIEDFDTQDTAQRKAIKKGLKVMSREIQMAVAASCRALNHAEISFGQLPPERVGISFGSDYIVTSVEEVADGIRNCLRSESGKTLFDFSRWAEDGLPKMPPLWQLKYLPNMPASHIAILNDFQGPSNSLTMREATIGACLGESKEIIAAGRADVMLVGTTGSRLLPFKLLHSILPPKKGMVSDTACRPFDERRDGTVLGEGAGAIVLEELKHAEKRGAVIFGEVLCGSYRYGGEGSCTENVLKDVLRRSQMSPDKIGHINANGLGTWDDDLQEAASIHHVFGGRKEPVPVAGLKGFFGNLGAGGGAVEFIASVLALQYGTLFPTLGFETGGDCPLNIVKFGETGLAGDSFIKTAVWQNRASAVLVQNI